MHTLTASYGPDGPQVSVLVGLAASDVLALRQAGRPIPSAVAIVALIDTGAEVSCIDSVALKPLLAAGLKPARFVLANFTVAGGLKPAIEYAVGLTIVHPSGTARANLVVRELAVVEQSLGLVGCQGLIGRDVLARCMLVYDGPGKCFSMAY